MPYQPILGTLGYVRSRDRQRVLLVHRNARPEDEHLGKWNGLGGKLDPEETIVEGMRREVLEETGLVVCSEVLRGTISWPGFGKHGEDWFGFLYLIDDWEGEPPAANVEGTLSWEPISRLLSWDLPIWEGDKHFLPLVFDDDPRAFHGVMPYRDGRPISWRFQR